MSAPVSALRVHFYGTQGSGSVFPSRDERAAFERRIHHELVARMLSDLRARAGADGRASFTVDDLLGGPATPRAIDAYLDRVPLPEPRVYGGWTTCVWIETADDIDIVLDCGSGFRNCARDLQAKWGDRSERHLHLFGSHSHLDHTEGFDQAAVCFDPRNRVHVYGNRQFLHALDYNLGVFSRRVAPAAKGVQTPVFFGVMPATFDACTLGVSPDGDGQAPAIPGATHADLSVPVRLGATTITAFEVYHPAPCLAYRVEHAGRVFVFCTDHELLRVDGEHSDRERSLAAEARVIAASTGADLLYRDGQYLRAEYDGIKGIGGSGPVPRVGWGHSCLEDVIEMATACGVRRTLVGHHDPNRDWSERNWIDESLVRRAGAGAGPRIELARAETTFDL